MRFYLSDYVGDGITPETAFVPRVSTIQSSPYSWVEGRAVGNVNGPCLVYTNNIDSEHAALLADSNIKYLPLEDAAGNVLSMNDTLSMISTVNRNKIITFMENRHIPTQGLNGQSPIRRLVRRIFKRFILRGNLRGLDLIEGLDTNITDIPLQRRQQIKARLEDKGFDTSNLSGTVRDVMRSLMNQKPKAMRFKF